MTGGEDETLCDERLHISARGGDRVWTRREAVGCRRHWTEPGASRAECVADSPGEGVDGKGVGTDGEADRGGRPVRRGLCARPRPSSLALRAAERRRPRGGN